MLVLQRKMGESIQIGEDITITFVEMGNHTVKVAIEAPKNITILRSELVQAMKANQDSVVSEMSLTNLQNLIAQTKSQVSQEKVKNEKESEAIPEEKE